MSEENSTDTGSLLNDDETIKTKQTSLEAPPFPFVGGGVDPINKFSEAWHKILPYLAIIGGIITALTIITAVIIFQLNLNNSIKSLDIEVENSQKKYSCRYSIV